MTTSCNGAEATAVRASAPGVDRFSGVIVPLVTPLTSRRAVDEGAIERLVNHLVAGGTHGLLALGTTGEFVSLDVEKRCAVLRAVARANAGRLPLYVGAGDTSIDTTRAMIHVAAEVGADAIALVPPYYFPLTEEQVAQYYLSVASESPLPVMLYNIPGFTRVHVTPGVVRAAVTCDKVIGIKDSSGDLDTLKSFINEFRRPGKFRVMVGSENLLWDGLEAGADGVVPSSANRDPLLWSSFFEAFRAGKMDSAREWLGRIGTATAFLQQDAASWPAYLKNLKRSLSEELRLCEPWLAPPLESWDQDRVAG